MGHEPPNIRRPPAYPIELTYPCCLPTLGELGEVPPHGGLRAVYGSGGVTQGEPAGACPQARGHLSHLVIGPRDPLVQGQVYAAPTWPVEGLGVSASSWATIRSF